MKRLFNLRFASILLLVLVAAAASVVGWSSNEPDPGDAVRTENKTRSLIIESVTDAEKMPGVPQSASRRLRVTVRNGYSQPVVAYSFRQMDTSTPKKSMSGVTTNGATIGWKLAPGATDVTRFSVAATGEVVLTLTAVLLEDGTGDGDVDELAGLRNHRAGVKEAYQEIVPMLRKAAASGERVTGDAALQSLKNEIESIPEGNLLLTDFPKGVVDGKALVTFEIKELEDRLRSGRELDYRTGIRKLLSQIEEYLAQL
jgi:hypothetical protein